MRSSNSGPEILRISELMKSFSSSATSEELPSVIVLPHARLTCHIRHGLPHVNMTTPWLRLTHIRHIRAQRCRVAGCGVLHQSEFGGRNQSVRAPAAGGQVKPPTESRTTIGAQ